MICFLEGDLVEKNTNQIVVAVGGVGFDVQISASTYNLIGLPPAKVKIFTYLHLREDGIQLFGFATQSEKGLFLLLNSVTGIGPRTSLSILAHTSVSDFTRNILKGDSAALSTIPGIGKKTGERLILELKDKVKQIDLAEPTEEIQLEFKENVRQAIAALERLGFHPFTAKNAVLKVTQLSAEELTAEELVRRSLQYTT